MAGFNSPYIGAGFSALDLVGTRGDDDGMWTGDRP
jgi:hypothetical protein